MDPQLKTSLVAELVTHLPEIVAAFAALVVAILTRAKLIASAADKSLDAVVKDVPHMPEGERARFAKSRMRKTLGGKLTNEAGRHVAVQKAREKRAKKAAAA